MTGISPVVEELQDCVNDAERARWLLKIPVVLLYREQTAIYRVLRNARFARGEELVNIEISALLLARDRFGRLPAETDAVVSAARSFMEALARKGGAA